MSSDPRPIQCRHVGNAVFLEHAGESGDLAAWGMPDEESARFVAKAVNGVLLRLDREVSRLRRELEANRGQGVKP